MASNKLFEKISFFNIQEFGFTLNFPNESWIYCKVSLNEFWFINEFNNQAIILNSFRDKLYDYKIINNENQNGLLNTKIGDYDAFLKCKKFVEDSILQYEWLIIDSGIKIIFSCPIIEEKSESDKDKDYEEALLILNSLKNKKNDI